MAMESAKIPRGNQSIVGNGSGVAATVDKMQECPLSLWLVLDVHTSAALTV
jgi:hypothetical protein